MSAKKISALERGIRNATERKEREIEKSAGINDFPPPGLQFLYRPMWNIKGGSLSTCSCLPTRLHGIEMLTDDRVLPDCKNLKHLHLLDQSLLRHAGSDLRRLINEKNLPLISIAVHCATLAAAGPLKEYLELCRELSESMRRRLIFCMTGIPAGIPNAEIASWLMYLKPFGRFFLGRFTDPEVDLSASRETGFTAVGVDLAEQKFSEQQVIESFDKFVFSAKQNGLHSCITGLKTTSLAIAAVGAGFNFIEGPVIMGAGVTEPPRVVPYGLTDLYAIGDPEDGG